MNVTSRIRPALLRLAPALLLGLLVAAPAPAATGPPIVLVSIDTLRSDRLPAYGYRRVETPAIDALARDGVVFEQAFAHVPLTLPSHLSMLSGVLPGDHGVRDNLGYRFDAGRHPWAPALLRAAGYRTAAAISAYVLRPETGFAAGFERFDAEIDPGTSGDFGAAQRPGRAAVDAATAWLDEVREQPFFLFVHLYEPHTPYEPGEPFRSRYPDPYDGEVAAADALVGELVAALRVRGLYDRALVLLVSDHGEGLGDHGEAEHGVLLYREALQVPLIAKLPGGDLAGRRVAALAQLADVAPTLLAAAGLRAPPAMIGRSLDDLARGKVPARKAFAETVYPRLHYGWSDLASVVELPHHLIFGPDPELYRLDRDPREATNVRAAERRPFHDLRLEAERLRAPLRPPAEEDPETARKLAALGYLGGAARAEGPLADPKSKLGLLAEFRSAVTSLEAGRAAEAVPVLEKVVADTPGMTEGWVRLGAARVLAGQRESALTAYQKALELAPGSVSAALGLAGVLRDLGRHDEARRHAELVLASAPSLAHGALAGIAISARDFATAEREARAALAPGGARLANLIQLARALNGQKRPADALAALADAEGEMKRLPPGSRSFAGLHLARGDAHVQLDHPRDAFDAYKRELEAFPDEPLAYVSMALLFQAVGRPRDAVATLRTLVTTNPNDPAAYRAAVSTLQKLGAASDARRVLAEGLRRFPADPLLAALRDGRSVGPPSAP